MDPAEGNLHKNRMSLTNTSLAHSLRYPDSLLQRPADLLAASQFFFVNHLDQHCYPEWSLFPLGHHLTP
uniref:Uncharacterized protein n=1 Tax=Arundo donax TaxID=35708 RepID=A0A0A9CTB5_ARUDO